MYINSAFESKQFNFKTAQTLAMVTVASVENILARSFQVGARFLQ